MDRQLCEQLLAVDDPETSGSQKSTEFAKIDSKEKNHFVLAKMIAVLHLF